MTVRREGSTTLISDEAPAHRGEPRWAAAVRVVMAPGLAADNAPLTPVGRTLQIGRTAELALGDDKLSRSHCSVFERERPGEYALADLGSRNGTFLNGRRVSRERLRPNDVLRAGDCLLVFTRVPGANAADLPPPLLGESAVMREIAGALRKIAATDLTLLLEGETGTGKELVARALHLLSGRSGPFLALNTAAVPPALFESELFGHLRGAFTGAIAEGRGLFVSAHGGTLFLDEVGEMPAETQTKLLRAVEQKRIRPVGGTREVAVDARIIAATNTRLREAIDRGSFRADLYARLGEGRLALPALRERREDILPLARHFASEALGGGAAPRFTPDFAEALLCAPWPFNVRELRSLMRWLAALHGSEPQWDLDFLPPELQEPIRHRQATSPAGGAERTEVPSEGELRRALERHRGNVKELAKELGKARVQVYRWLHRYGLRPSAFRSR